jgi:ABC-type branched-subunit amino acid transport system substrate-binding protein
MLQRPFAWVADNRLIAAGMALVLVAVTATVAILANSGSNESSKIASPGQQSQGGEFSSPGTTSGGLATKGEAKGAGGGSVSVGGPAGIAKIPGLATSPAAKPCTPRSVTQTGVTKNSITIGQIVTDNSAIPQQLRPAHEGLQAFVKLFNAAGGLCHRQLKLDYRNDNFSPAAHRTDAQDLANSALAFVGNESLWDQLDYEQNPPFAPTVSGGGGSVPDVGGLAFSYNRSQSAWHAGVIGSLSPTLIGGGQFRFFLNEAKSKGAPCRKGAIVYLQEPTGASQDEAELGQPAVEESWGGGLGKGTTKLYSAGLLDPEPAYEELVDRMVADGMNCVFTYTDLSSNIKLAQAMNSRGVWPQSKCKLQTACFRVVYIPLAAYDQQFIRDGGDGATDVSTFIPHVPFTELQNTAMKAYVDALKGVPGARPSTFSVLGFTSGVMLIQGLSACPDAPTRACLIKGMRGMKDFSAGGLLGGTTPFRTTRATYSNYGTFDWKWIFNKSIVMRVETRNGKRDFYRITPASGFFSDTLHVARGTPA